MTHADLYIGLMSGTSADGVDAVLVDFNKPEPKLVAKLGTVFPRKLRKRIHDLCEPSFNELDRAGVLDTQLGRFFSDAVLELLKAAKVSSTDVKAIGSHGQTLRHRPPGSNSSYPFTWQVGDPNTIVSRTDITTVADFRRRDMALGGQGAPLVPAFHEAVFSHKEKTRAIVNIGGIANISWLTPNQETLGFDTGPGNNLMDLWICRHKNQTFDADGAWAQSGACNAELLAVALAHPYFTKKIPKSTGREDFNLAWLNQILVSLSAEISPQDVQATLLMLTVESIAHHIECCIKDNALIEIYVCGGGALNEFLMVSLSQRLSQHTLTTTSALGLDPDWVEAVAFAWLAKQTIENLTGNLPSVTGASSASILGGIYPSSKPIKN